MPQVTVYIRNEDLSKWRALSNKADFISKALNKNTPPEEPEPAREQDTLVLGRACCLNKKARCQHWQYNMDTGEMINTLTGETMYA